MVIMMLVSRIRNGRIVPLYRRCLSSYAEAVEPPASNKDAASTTERTSDVPVAVKKNQTHGMYAGDNLLEYTSTMEVVKPEKVSERQ